MPDGQSIVIELGIAFTTTLLGAGDDRGEIVDLGVGAPRRNDQALDLLRAFRLNAFRMSSSRRYFRR